VCAWNCLGPGKHREPEDEDGCGQRVLAGAGPRAAGGRVNHPSAPAESTLLAGVAAIFAELCSFRLM